jgi:hypothetical protein
MRIDTHFHLSRILLLCLAVLSASCASSPPVQVQPATVGIGESKQTAIEVCKPAGERAYLSRLVCSTGQSPTFKRVGSIGSRNEIPNSLSAEQQKVLLDKLLRYTPLQPGEPDYHVIDGYEVVCGEEKRIVFLDMYHCDQPPPSAAIRGFTIRAPK